MKRVWVMYTNNDSGPGISVHETRESAIDSLFEWVALCWDYCFRTKIPGDKEKAIREFYEASHYRDGEEYYLEECIIQKEKK